MNNKANKLKANRGQALRYNSGQAVLTVIIILLLASMVLVFGNVIPVLGDVKVANEFIESKRAAFASEGGLEDVTYRAVTGKDYDASELIEINGSSVTITASEDVLTSELLVRAEGITQDSVRVKESRLLRDDQASFHYGLQVGNGGLEMKNSSSIVGNVYSGGTIEGDGNLIDGTAVSAGASGLIDNIETTVDAFAHSIVDSVVGVDAYYQVIDNTVIGASDFPDSPDLPAVDMPISEATLDAWEEIAESGTVVNCSGTHKIEDDEVIGPAKYTCDVEIKKDAVVTLAGMVWVEGDIKIKNDAHIKLDPALGQHNVAIIAHDPADEEDHGLIELENNSTYEGSGSPSTYVMLVSRNNDASQGGDKKAIEMHNNAEGDVLLYTNGGRIVIKNNVDLIAVTGYLVELQNNATIHYDTGIADSIFETGPSTGWQINSWREVE